MIAPARPAATPVRRIIAVARKELQDTFRDRRTLLVTLLPALVAGPLVLMLMFTVIAGQLSRAQELKLPTVGRAHSPALVAFLERQQVTLTDAPADYEAKIRGGELDVVLVIDDKFESDVAEGRVGTVRLVYDRSRDRAQAGDPRGRVAAARLQPAMGIAATAVARRGAHRRAIRSTSTPSTWPRRSKAARSCCSSSRTTDCSRPSWAAWQWRWT